jgi:hypothetical protein
MAAEEPTESFLHQPSVSVPGKRVCRSESGVADTPVMVRSVDASTVDHRILQGREELLEEKRKELANLLRDHDDAVGGRLRSLCKWLIRLTTPGSRVLPP